MLKGQNIHPDSTIQALDYVKTQQKALEKLTGPPSVHDIQIAVEIGQWAQAEEWLETADHSLDSVILLQAQLLRLQHEYQEAEDVLNTLPKETAESWIPGLMFRAQLWLDAW